MKSKIVTMMFFALLTGCNPSWYMVQSNPTERALLDATTELKLINKSNEAVVFYIVNCDFPDDEITVEVKAKGKTSISNFDCGRYNIFVKDQMLDGVRIRPKFRNKLTYEIKRNG